MRSILRCPALMLSVCRFSRSETLEMFWLIRSERADTVSDSAASVDCVACSRVCPPLGSDVATFSAPTIVTIALERHSCG
jgi:succinate dehydrogenase/fumarate reductase-like Fe-S protein